MSDAISRRLPPEFMQLEGLVDAFIASDLALTGTMKSFIRNDTDHPWTSGWLAIIDIR
ncbi:MAG: hypothetical protein USCGTAYLOR_02693 [Chromatiales bacterium USCg_Taylor]|nr:MAG: hypothetical protein USCGTAYLOR_02693 [Chromatiales bacterium USCg_Taylor]